MEDPHARVLSLLERLECKQPYILSAHTLLLSKKIVSDSGILPESYIYAIYKLSI